MEEQILAQAIDPTGWFSQIAQTGLLGALLLVMGWAYIKKDGELSKERAARLEDAKAVTNIITPMVDTATSARVAATNAQEAQNRLLETLTRNQEALAQRINKP